MAFLVILNSLTVQIYNLFQYLFISKMNVSEKKFLQKMFL